MFLTFDCYQAQKHIIYVSGNAKQILFESNKAVLIQALHKSMKISSDLVLCSVACVIFKQFARSGIMIFLAIVLATEIKGHFGAFQSWGDYIHCMYISVVYETLCPFASELEKNNLRSTNM